MSDRLFISTARRLFIRPDSRPGVVANVAEYFSTHFILKSMSNTIVVAVSNQKGGVGKSTLTVLLASYLYYVKGYDVAVLDCDSPQHSLHGERQRELSDVRAVPHLAKMSQDYLAATGKQPYAVMKVELEDALEKVGIYLERYQPDFLFLDLPGTINNVNILNLLANVHHVFCPMVADTLAIESTLPFCRFLRDRIISVGLGNIKSVNVVWNKVDARERTHLYHAYDDLMEELNIDVMKTTLPASVRFRKGLCTEEKKPVFRSTLFPPDKSLIKNSGIEELVAEFLAITGRKDG